MNVFCKKTTRMYLLIPLLFLLAFSKGTAQNYMSNELAMGRMSGHGEAYFQQFKTASNKAQKDLLATKVTLCKLVEAQLRAEKETGESLEYVFNNLNSMPTTLLDYQFSVARKDDPASFDVATLKKEIQDHLILK